MDIPYVRPTHPQYEYNVSQSALWATWQVLKPHHILDIGTWEGTSANLAGLFLDQQGGDGKVVTLDVVKVMKDYEQHPRVTQLQVYPLTTTGLGQYSWARSDKMLPDWKEHIGDVQGNLERLKAMMKYLGIKQFDFAYVDGDHSEQGILMDLELVQQVVKPPYYAMLDDVYSNWFGCHASYHNIIKHEWQHYDFETPEWKAFPETRKDVIGWPRMALVWKGQQDAPQTQ